MSRRPEGRNRVPGSIGATGNSQGTVSLPSRKRRTQSVFWFTYSPVPISEVNIYLVKRTSIDLRCTPKANPEGNIVQSGDSNTFVITFEIYVRYTSNDH